MNPGTRPAFYAQRRLKCAAMRRAPRDRFFALLAAACGRPAPLDLSGPTSDWREYAGDKGGLHFSRLTQVTPANVKQLELVWRHRSGDYSAGSDRARPRRSR